MEDEVEEVDIDDVKAAVKWIKNADCVLVCAGAGMSANSDNGNVYINKDDFNSMYPGMEKYGYTTSYQCMGLFSDKNLPLSVKWGYQAQHINYQRYAFPPNKGYGHLLEILKNKDYFVLTSNVDGYFIRAGFPKERVYTPQGDWMWLQCKTPCSREVWDSKPVIDKILPTIVESNITDPDVIPVCPKCKGAVFGNVRGGDYFIHDHFEEKLDQLIKWIDDAKNAGKKIAVIEIGAGFNTPVVTRYPMESIARLIPKSCLIRINPTDWICPRDVTAVGLPIGWEIFEQMITFFSAGDEKEWDEAEKRVLARRVIEAELSKKNGEIENWRRYRHFDWKIFLHQLREKD